MEKTYYKNLVIREKSGIFVAEFEFSEECEGFFMPMATEGKTAEEAKEMAFKFLGEDAQEC